MFAHCRRSGSGKVGGGFRCVYVISTKNLPKCQKLLAKLLYKLFAHCWNHNLRDVGACYNLSITLIFMSKETSWYNQKRNGVKVGYRLLAFIAYWSPVMSLIAGFVARKRSKFALFHSIQGGLVNVALIIVSQLVSRSAITANTPIFLVVAWFVLWLLLWILLFSLLFLMISAFWGKQYHLPLVGKFSKALTDRWFPGQSDQSEKSQSS